MELAIIKTGGKQYLVSPGQRIKFEKIDTKEGEKITFSEVLLVQKENKFQIGTPLVENAKVIGKVIRHGKEKKITILKHRPRKRYKVKKGHRQAFTEIEILKIEV